MTKTLEKIMMILAPLSIIAGQNYSTNGNNNSERNFYNPAENSNPIRESGYKPQQ